MFILHKGVAVKLTTMTVVAALVMASGMVEATAIYRWLDESGTVVYSQTLPKTDTKWEWIQVKTFTAKAIPAEGDEPEEEDATAATEEKKSEGNPALDDELRKDYCERGRKTLKVLEEAGLDASFVNDEGKAVKLSVEEREGKLKEAKIVIRAYCDDEKDE